MRQRQPGEPGYVSGRIEKRRAKIIARLCKILVSKDCNASHNDDDKIFVSRGDEKCTFRLREKSKEGRRPLTEWEQRYNPTKRKDAFALIPTGCFVFVSWFEKGRLFKRDATDEHIIETIVPVILADLDDAALRSKKRVEDEKRWKEQRQRSSALAEQKAIAENRWNSFKDLAARWREAQVCRDFLEAIEATQRGIGAEDIDWLKTEIDKRDPVKNAGCLLPVLASAN